MKTMVSTIICLASSKEVILLDEPVLGFDAIMRVEFYDMLTESFKKHPRIIIVSTHIIEEIAKAIENLIIIDQGQRSLLRHAAISRRRRRSASVGLQQGRGDGHPRDWKVIGQDTVGGLVTRCIFDTPPQESALD